MPDSLKYYMWGYQDAYLANAQSAAERAFDLLDPALEPTVFLVGFLQEGREAEHPVCVAPDDCPYQPDVFAGVPAEGRRLYEAPRKSWVIIQGDDDGRMTEEYERHRALSFIGAALQQVLSRLPDASRFDFYCTNVRHVRDYLVSAVVRLARGPCQAWPRLTKSEITPSFSVPQSLLDTTISAFLRACGEGLHRPDAGKEPRLLNDARDVVRAAGKSFMLAPEHAGGNMSGHYKLFDACNAISTLRYEGAEGVGQIILASPQHPHLRVDLRLTNRVSLHDYRAVRKLLQLSSADLSLLSDSDEVYGLGGLTDGYDPAKEDAFRVRFSGQFLWDLWHADQPLMRVRFGNPERPLPEFPAEKLETDLQRVFGGLRPEAVAKLCALAQVACEQMHGTMLMISAEAAGEAERLRQQATKIEPARLEDGLLRRVTRIDGAVLVDLDGICHAVGVILDGQVSERCTPSRGARYNSAIRYVHGRHAAGKKDCFAVIKSEDGMIDLVPNLMPRIRKTELQAALVRLEAVTRAADFENSKFWEAMRWFESHRFYLQEGVCARVNELRETAESRRRHDDWWVEYEPFVPEPDMDDSYFVGE